MREEDGSFKSMTPELGYKSQFGAIPLESR
jgi:hypothetical protein